VFERATSECSESVSAAFGGPEFGNILTGLQANVNWLESTFAAEFPREDVLEALDDIREAQQRLMWFCREAALLSGIDTFGMVTVPVEVTPLLREAASNLDTRLGADTRLDFTSVPSAMIHADRELIVRMFERVFETALQITTSDTRIEVRGFADGDAIHVVVTSFGDADAAESMVFAPAAPSLEEIVRAIPVRFCDQVARAHQGRLVIRRTEAGTAFHISLSTDARGAEASNGELGT